MQKKNSNNDCDCKNKYAGFVNYTKLTDWSGKNITGSNNILVYNYIARMTAGYAQSVSISIGYDKIAKHTSLSRSSIYRALKYLKENDFIKREKSNIASEKGSNGDRYSIVFKPEDESFPYLIFTKETIDDIDLEKPIEKPKLSLMD